LRSFYAFSIILARIGKASVLFFTVFTAGSWWALAVVFTSLKLFAFCSILARIWMTGMRDFMTRKSISIVTLHADAGFIYTLGIDVTFLTNVHFTVRSSKTWLTYAQIMKEAMIPFIRISTVTAVRVNADTAVQTRMSVTRMRDFTFISFEKWRTVAFIVSIRHSTVSAM